MDNARRKIIRVVVHFSLDSVPILAVLSLMLTYPITLITHEKIYWISPSH